MRYQLLMILLAVPMLACLLVAQDCPTYTSFRFNCSGDNGCQMWQVASYCGYPDNQYYQCYDCSGYGLCCDQEFCEASWIGECGEGLRPTKQLSRLYIQNCKGGLGVRMIQTNSEDAIESKKSAG